MVIKKKNNVPNSKFKAQLKINENCAQQLTNKKKIKNKIKNKTWQRF